MKLTNGVNNAVSCYKEAVHSMLPLLHPFASFFEEIWGTAMNFMYFLPG